MGSFIRIFLVLITVWSLTTTLNAVNKIPLSSQTRYRTGHGDLGGRYAHRFQHKAYGKGRPLFWFCRPGLKSAFCHRAISSTIFVNNTYPGVFSGTCNNEKCVHGICRKGFCHCKRGWEGRNCDKDIDECLSVTNYPCQQLCFNTPGSFRCRCRYGYSQASDGIHCIWVMPKEWRKNMRLWITGRRRFLRHRLHRSRSRRPILPNGNMSKTFSRLRQLKRPGATPSTKHSQRSSTLTVQRSSDTPCKKECGYKCIKQEEKCSCPKGFTLASDEISCIDRNECLDISSFRCPVNKICRNTLGSFKCVCRSGFTSYGMYLKDCGDINECLTGEHRCGRNSICQNTIGSYTCNCRPGYLKAGVVCIQQNRTDAVLL